MSLSKPIHKTSVLIPYEQLFIQIFHHNGNLIAEQGTGVQIPLNQVAIDTMLISTTWKQKQTNSPPTHSNQFQLFHDSNNNTDMYPLFNKNQAAWNFLSPELEFTWRTIAIIIRAILFSPYLCICGVSLSSIHYNQSRRVCINQRHQYILLIWS